MKGSLLQKLEWRLNMSEIRTASLIIRELTPDQKAVKDRLIGITTTTVTRAGVETDPEKVRVHFKNIAGNFSTSGNEDFSLYEMGSIIGGLPIAKAQIALEVFRGGVFPRYRCLEAEEYVNNALIARGAKPVKLDDQKYPLPQEGATSTEGETTALNLNLTEDLEAVGERVQASFKEIPPTIPDLEGKTVDEFWGKVDILKQEGVRYGEVEIEEPRSYGSKIDIRYRRPIFDQAGNQIGTWTKIANVIRSNPPELDTMWERVSTVPGNSEGVRIVLENNTQPRVFERNVTTGGNSANTERLTYSYNSDGRVVDTNLEYDPDHSMANLIAEEIFIDPQSAVHRLEIVPEGVRRNILKGMFEHSLTDNNQRADALAGLWSRNLGGEIVNQFNSYARAYIDTGEAPEVVLESKGDFKALLDEGAEILKEEGSFVTEFAPEDVEQVMRQVIVTDEIKGLMEAKGVRAEVESLDVQINDAKGKVKAAVPVSKKFMLAYAHVATEDINFALSNEEGEEGPTGRLLTSNLKVVPEKILWVKVKEQIEKHIAGDKINDSFKKVLDSQMVTRGAKVEGIALEFTPANKLRVRVVGGSLAV